MEARDIRVGNRTYHVLLTRDVVDGGFVAECPALPGCVTDGETADDALHNAALAIADWRRIAKSEHAPNKFGG